MFTSYGYIKYNPQGRGKTRQDPWWLILQCSRGIPLLYKYFLESDASKVISSTEAFGIHGWSVTQHGIKVSESVWCSHVSVIRGEEPIRKDLWGKYENERVSFEYDPRYLNTNGRHWWIRITSPRLEEIRLELGLHPQPTFVNYFGQLKVDPFHITVGKDVNAEPSVNSKREK